MPTRLERMLPNHRLAWPWVLVLLLIPAGVIAIAPRESVWNPVAAVFWLVISLPLTVAALLDWSRTTSSSSSRWARAIRRAASLPAIALGFTAVGLAAIAPAHFGTRGWRAEHVWFLAWFMTNAAALGAALLWQALGRRRRHRSPSGSNGA